MLVRALGKDNAAFCVCAVLGMLVRYVLGPMYWVEIAEILFAYQLFLIWLLFLSDTGEGRPRNGVFILSAIHAGCIALLVAVKFALAAALFAFLRAQSPANVSIAYTLGTKAVWAAQILVVYALAFTERRWLFGAERNAPSVSPGAPGSVAAASAPARRRKQNGPLAAATGADYFEWQQHLSRQSAFRVPGKSQQDEYELWLRARGKTQYPSAAGEPAGTAASTA